MEHHDQSDSTTTELLEALGRGWWIAPAGIFGALAWLAPVAAIADKF
ncbi:hypothetical protein [Pseudoroseicyclus tamaricis]|uniref:Uncharacterized protein n=1 Tax=Pseudoroseicyclus tamaricis TaxID=2705421 RepID=A0A6B2JM38_9RHOB|nr:hypothetical protein [Pseudoroseicyclus tamaricis]NDV02641.1 hypothetical protein [Pseudoroseicyclus tamaricis]